VGSGTEVIGIGDRRGEKLCGVEAYGVKEVWEMWIRKGE